MTVARQPEFSFCEHVYVQTWCDHQVAPWTLIWNQQQEIKHAVHSFIYLKTTINHNSDRLFHYMQNVDISCIVIWNFTLHLDITWMNSGNDILQGTINEWLDSFYGKSKIILNWNRMQKASDYIRIAVICVLREHLYKRNH